MRTLFSGLPAPGHLLPMLPLLRAANRAGHQTALMTGADQAPLLDDVAVLPAGPPLAALVEETMRRPEGGDPSQPGPGAIELMAGVAVDLTIDEAVAQATAFGPDLIVCEDFCHTAPLVAATLRVPWVSHRISGGVPPELGEAFARRAVRHYDERGLVPTAPIVRVDPYPDILRGSPADPERDRLPMRPSPHAAGGPSTPPAFDSLRPTVLLTIGTSIAERDGDPLPRLLRSALTVDVNVVVTAEPSAIPSDVQASRVRAVGFTPLADLLSGVDVVVTAGGTGTLLAAVAEGLPLVIRPIKADQPWNAERAAKLGVAVVIEDEDAAGPALEQVLRQPSYAEAAHAAAKAIAELPSSDAVLEEIVRRCELTPPSAGLGTS